MDTKDLVAAKVETRRRQIVLPEINSRSEISWLYGTKMGFPAIEIFFVVVHPHLRDPLVVLLESKVSI